MPQVSLTDRFAAGVKSPAVQTDYFDDNAKTRGLCLRVSGVGRKTWCLLFTSPKDCKRARMIHWVAIRPFRSPGPVRLQLKLTATSLKAVTHAM